MIQDGTTSITKLTWKKRGIRKDLPVWLHGVHCITQQYSWTSHSITVAAASSVLLSSLSSAECWHGTGWLRHSHLHRRCRVESCPRAPSSNPICKFCRARSVPYPEYSLAKRTVCLFVDNGFPNRTKQIAHHTRLRYHAFLLALGRSHRGHHCLANTVLSRNSRCT